MPSTQSIWQAAAPPTRSVPPPPTCDVAVVGAGIAGASAALALHEAAPGLRVHVFEARAPGFGATGRNAGFLLLGTSRDYASAVDAVGRDRARRLWAFTAESARRVTQDARLAAAGGELGGAVTAAGDAAEAERLTRSHALLAEDGIATELLTGDAVAARTGMRGFPAALVAPGGSVNSHALTRAVLAASGAPLTAGWRLAGVEADGGGVRLHAADGTEVRAGRAYLALGAYVTKVVASAADVVRPVRAQMLATEPLPPLVHRPVYSHEGYFYLRTHPSGALLLGGARHLHRDAEVGFEDATTEPLQRDLEAYLARHVPAAAGARIARRWSGTMSFTADGLPVLADVPDVPGALWGGGFTGHGMGFSLRFGDLVARRLLGEPDADADLFDPTRSTLIPSAAPVA